MNHLDSDDWLLLPVFIILVVIVVIELIELWK